MTLTLISHKLCPYVQRAVIALTEKGVTVRTARHRPREQAGLVQAVSPLGKTPVLLVGETAIFESAVILEYLEETQSIRCTLPIPLPAPSIVPGSSSVPRSSATSPGSTAPLTIAAFNTKATALKDEFARVETRLQGPWFDGERFSLVDAVFGPVFRYFDAFDRIGDFGILGGLSNVAAWRALLAERPSVQAAVAPNTLPCSGSSTARAARISRG